MKIKKDNKNNAIKEHLDKMRLLTAKDSFQDAVQKIRENLNLPAKGFNMGIKEQVQKYSNWYQQFAEENNKKTKIAVESLEKLRLKVERQIELHKKFAKINKELMILTANNTHRLQELYKSPRYRLLEEKYNKIKKQLDSAVIEPDYFWKEKSKILSDIPENYLNDQIDGILYKYHLPASYKECIEWYVYHNETKIIPNKNFIIEHGFSKISKWIDPELMDRYQGSASLIVVKIFTPLKTRDLKQLIKELKLVQPQVFRKGLMFKIRPDSKIEELIRLAEEAKGSKQGPGQPKKQELCVKNSYYFQMLKKRGDSDKEINKIIKDRELKGYKVDRKKIKIEVTSSPRARKAKYKIKQMQQKMFPIE